MMPRRKRIKKVDMESNRLMIIVLLLQLLPLCCALSNDQAPGTRGNTSFSTELCAHKDHKNFWKAFLDKLLGPISTQPGEAPCPKTHQAKSPMLFALEQGLFLLSATLLPTYPLYKEILKRCLNFSGWRCDKVLLLLLVLPKTGKYFPYP